MNNQQFRNVVYLSDVSGTGQWRRIWQINSINCVSQGLGVQCSYSQTPILDQNFYKGVNSVTVQRWINDQQVDLFCKFLKPLMDMNSGWLIYEIDDNMADVHIPKFNRGRKAFEGEKIQSNIKKMLNAADFVTVTTDYIKNFYHKHYGVPLDRIIAVPNLLPRYLFGDRYDLDKKIEQFRKFKQKPRIGIVSSLSHFNVDDVRIGKDGLACRKERLPDGREIWKNEVGNEVPEDQISKITDDFDDIADCVRSTVDEFQWVCFGYCPPQIKDLADKRKIEVHGGVPIMNYASMLENLNLQAIVSPIKKIEFNFCKSFIKTMECAAIGVPLFATNCLPYSRVMKPTQLFDTSDELKEKLRKLKFGSIGIYKNIIENQWKWLNSPCREGDFNIKNFWLEDNLNIWIDMNRLKQKTLNVSYASFIAQFNARKLAEAQSVIAKSESGEAMILK